MASDGTEVLAGSTAPETGWMERLSHPAIGNVCAVLALVVAVAAGIGLLRQTVFWLVFGYVVLSGAFLLVLAVARHRDQRLRALRVERDELESEVRKRPAGSRLREAFVAATENLEASEAGYEALRTAVIEVSQGSRGGTGRFDDELAAALRELERPRSGTSA